MVVAERKVPFGGEVSCEASGSRLPTVTEEPCFEMDFRGVRDKSDGEGGDEVLRCFMDWDRVVLCISGTFSSTEDGALLM